LRPGILALVVDTGAKNLDGRIGELVRYYRYGQWHAARDPAVRGPAHIWFVYFACPIPTPCGAMSEMVVPEPCLIPLNDPPPPQIAYERRGEHVEVLT
jgi:hypothetical protein